MKKKVLYSLVLALVMICNVFTSACSFIGTNTKNYYNTVVATIGDDIEITKYELISLYNSYGYSYVEDGYYTVEQAFDAILDQIINKHIMTKYIKDNYEDIFGVESLEKWEKSVIWKDTFDYVDKELLTYVNAIRKNKGLEEISSSDDDTAATTYLRKDYQKQIEIVIENNEIVGVKSVNEDTHDRTLDLDINKYEFKFYGDKNSNLDKQINELAQKKLRSYLKVNAEDSTKSDDEILEEHLQKMYDDYEGTYLISKFEENYKANQVITSSSILEKYKSYVRVDKDLYTNLKSTYISRAQSSISKIYYHPYEEELIYVSHILVKYDYNNDDYNLKDVYDKKYASGEITEQQYNYYTSDEYLGNQCKVYEIVDGEFDTENVVMNANELYVLVQNELSKISDPDARLDKFVDLTYKYNQDTGLFSSSDFYTIQLDTSYTDTMVEEFANLSRDLYNNGGVGSYGICYTQYGAHIVYVAGVVENVLPLENESALNSLTVEQLNNVVIKNNMYNFGTYTLLDRVAESCLKDNYTEYEKLKITEVKSSYKDTIVKYPKRYADLIG